MSGLHAAQTVSLCIFTVQFSLELIPARRFIADALLQVFALEVGRVRRPKSSCLSSLHPRVEGILLQGAHFF